MRQYFAAEFKFPQPIFFCFLKDRTNASNKFVIKGSHVTVEYTIGDNPSFHALTYTDSSFQRKASNPTQSRPMIPGLASLSLSLWWFRSMRAVSGSDSFLPSIDVPSGETAHFHTIQALRNVQRTRLDSPQAVDMAVHRNEWHCAERDCATVD